MPKDFNAPEIKEERRQLLELIKQNTRRNISIINTLYVGTLLKFGNELIYLNKAIFYSEILGVKKIIISKHNNLYLKNNLYDKEYNLTIEISDGYNFHEPNSYSLSYLFPVFYYDFFSLKVPNRFDIIKHEILKNLPEIKVDPDTLFIYFRTGDTFRRPRNGPTYIPYPLCFYEKVIKENNFAKIRIISEDKQNPIINYLLNKYSHIQYNNNLITDISYLANAYNIVGAISSFIIGIIKLNINLKKYWEYDIYPIAEKIRHLHPIFYNYSRNYTSFIMEPSEQYKMKMHSWSKSDDQLKIIFNDTCPYDFKIY